MNVYLAGNALDWAALLWCAGAGFVVARRAGLFNIGIEGQMYAGGFCASAVMLALSARPGLPPALVLACGLAAAPGAGALMAAVCALLRVRRGANELITSFLLSAAVTPCLDYLIGGPLRGVEGSLLAMRKLPPALALPRVLPPSNLNVSFFAALALVLLCAFFLSRAAAGYRLRLSGGAPAFAAFAGIPPGYGQSAGLVFSGAAAGLAGFFAVCAAEGVCHQGFPGGAGWAAITAGLIARNGVLALLPAALFYAALKSFMDAALLSSGASAASLAALTGLALFFITGRRRFRLKPPSR